MREEFQLVDTHCSSHLFSAHGAAGHKSRLLYATKFTGSSHKLATRSLTSNLTIRPQELWWFIIIQYYFIFLNSSSRYIQAADESAIVSRARCCRGALFRMAWHCRLRQICDVCLWLPFNPNISVLLTSKITHILYEISANTIPVPVSAFIWEQNT